MQPLCRYHILLAEDNEFNQQLTFAVLEELGFPVTLAGDGEEAVALFREHPFDLILMDIGMPNMDGYEATRAIRKIEQSQGGHTPVFAITANTSLEERLACLDSGMDEVLTKPFSDKELLEGIARYKQKTCGDVIFTGFVTNDAKKKENGVCRTDTTNALSSILSERIITDFSGSPDRLATYFGLLCSDMDIQLAAMKAAYETADCSALQKAAHAAKGVAQGLRDQSLSRLAEEIEHRAKGGEISGIRDILSEYEPLYLLLKN